MAHTYIHSLPRNQEEIVNNMLRRYKRTINVAIIQGSEITAEEVEIDMSDCIEIPLIDNRKYNRAKTKREWEKKAREGLEDYYR